MLAVYLSLPFLLFALYRLGVSLYSYFNAPVLPEVIGTHREKFIVAAFHHSGDVGDLCCLIDELKVQTCRNFEVRLIATLSGTERMQVERMLEGDERFSLFVYDSNAANIADFFPKNLAAWKINSEDLILIVDTSIRLGRGFVDSAFDYLFRSRVDILGIYPYPKDALSAWAVLNGIIGWFAVSVRPVGKKGWLGTVSPVVASSWPILLRRADWLPKKLYDNEYVYSTDYYRWIYGVKRRGLNIRGVTGEHRILAFRTALSGRRATDIASLRLSALFSHNRVGFTLFVLIVISALPVIMHFLPYPLVFVFVFSLLASRAVASAMFNRSFMQLVLLLPLRLWFFIGMVFRIVGKGGRYNR